MGEKTLYLFKHVHINVNITEAPSAFLNKTGPLHSVLQSNIRLKDQNGINYFATKELLKATYYHHYYLHILYKVCGAAYKRRLEAHTGNTLENDSKKQGCQRQGQCVARRKP